MRDGWPDPACFASVIGGLFDQIGSVTGTQGSRVVAFGEMVALLWAEGKPEAAIRLEELWNDLAHTYSFSLHCAYPITNFNRDDDGDLFLKICAPHPAVIPTRAIPRCPRMRNACAASLICSRRCRKPSKLPRPSAPTLRNSLRRQQSELADLLENAVEGVQQVGADQKILRANKALLHLLSFSPAEYFGHQFSEFHVDENVFAEFGGG